MYLLFSTMKHRQCHHMAMDMIKVKYLVYRVEIAYSIDDKDINVDFH